MVIIFFSLHHSFCVATTHATDRSSDSNATKQKRLLFVEGGVSINPVFSMIQQWHVDIREYRMTGVDNRGQFYFIQDGAKMISYNITPNINDIKT
jgi:hypothetical protein